MKPASEPNPSKQSAISGDTPLLKRLTELRQAKTARSPFTTKASIVTGDVLRKIEPGANRGGGGLAITSNSTKASNLFNSTVSGNNIKYQSPTTYYGSQILLGDAKVNIVNSTVLAGYSITDKYQTDPESSLLFAYGVSSVSMSNSVLGSERLSVGGEYFGGGAVGASSQTGCKFADSLTLTQDTNNFFQDSSCNGTASGEARLSRLNSRNRADSMVTVGSPVIGGNVKYGNGVTNVNIMPPRAGHLPLFNSPLADAGDTTICSGPQIDGLDGFGRPHQGSACAIGALDSSNTIITVDSNADFISDEPDAVCTLRDALQVTAFVGGEGVQPRDNTSCETPTDLVTLRFAPSVFNRANPSIVTLQDDLPTIASPVQINGPGADALIISGGYEERMFRVRGADFSISNMTLTEAARSGAVSSRGSVVHLNRMVVERNESTSSGEGGGLTLGSSKAFIQQSTIRDNLLSLNAGRTGSGAGVLISGYGATVIDQSTISGNSAAENSFTLNGGGIAFASSGAAGPGSDDINFDRRSLVVVNSTVSGNSATNGGGVWAGGESESSSVAESYFRVLHSTISDNQATTLGGGVAVFGGNNGIAEVNGFIDGAIVSGNQAPQAAEVYFGNSVDVAFFVSVIGSDELSFSQAYINVEGDPGDGNVFATNTIEGGGENPVETGLLQILEPLQDNGGFTLTHAIPTGSPAIGLGSNKYCSNFSLNRDQRNISRTFTSCDSGSFEIDETACFVVPTANSKLVTFCL